MISNLTLEQNTHFSQLMTFIKKMEWLEVLLLVAVLPVIKILLGMTDPFFLASFFPWMAIPLTLIALRHGTATAFAGLTLLLLGLWLYQFYKGIPMDTTQLYPLSGIAVLTLVSGEITNYWRKQFFSEKKQFEETSEHVRKITQKLHVSQISHVQLESELLGIGRSLKSALAIIKNSFPEDLSEAQKASWVTHKMTAILSSYTWLESAAFVHVDEQKRTHSEAIAHIGGLDRIAPDDRLLRSVIKTGQMVWVKKESLLSGASGTMLIAAIPIHRNRHDITMILAIRHIRFNAYTRQNLNTLNVLCSWLGDMMSQGSRHLIPTAAGTTTADPNKKTIQHIDTFLRIWSGYKKSIFLLVARIPRNDKNTDHQAYFGSLAQGEDQQWTFAEEQQTTLLIALPLLTQSQANQYKGQVEEGYYKRFGSTTDDNNISLETICFSQPQKTHHLLQKLAL